MKLFILTVFLGCSCGAKISSLFSKTKVHENTCWDTPLLTVTGQSMRECMERCVRDATCRRFLFCSMSLICKFYKDGTDCLFNGDSASCSCFRKDIGFVGTQCTCIRGYYGSQCQNIVNSCPEALTRSLGDDLTGYRSAMTFIQPVPTSPPIEVECFYTLTGSTRILIRSTYCTQETYNRTLTEYEQGFGSASFNFWLGFNNILAIMDNNVQTTFTLEVMLYKTNWERCNMMYNGFKIGTKSTGYRLTLGSYSGQCGDSFMSLSGNSFSTYDDDKTGVNKCAARLGGGWWFSNTAQCSMSFLTGSLDDSTTNNFWLNNLSGQTLKSAVFLLYA